MPVPPRRPLSRRRVLGLVSVFGSGGLAGCSALSSDSGTGESMLDLTLFNHADSPYTVEIAIFQSGDPSRSDARVYDASVDIEPQGKAHRREVAETRPYLVRYSAYENGHRPTDEDHVHYYPPDDRDGDSLAFDIGSEGVLTRR